GALQRVGRAARVEQPEAPDPPGVGAGWPACRDHLDAVAERAQRGGVGRDEVAGGVTGEPRVRRGDDAEVHAALLRPAPGRAAPVRWAASGGGSARRAAWPTTAAAPTASDAARSP